MRRLKIHFDFIRMSVRPVIGDVRLRHCPLADRQHRTSWRNVAHTLHYPKTICVARILAKMPDENIQGVLWHEAGHLIMDEFVPEVNKQLGDCDKHHIEQEAELFANEVVETMFGIVIAYDQDLIQFVT